MTAPHDSTPLSLGELADEQYGQVIRPGDAEYDTVRAVYVGTVDRRPAVVLRPGEAAQVAHVVALARETGLDLAVRGGGHGYAGHGVCEGGIVLDLAALRGLEIDVAARTAWAGTGLRAGEYTAAAGEHGLATGFGDDALVGIGGLTLGGGVGFLTRKYGMTIDDLLAAEVVTADGQVVLTDEDHHPDLFWAIRGGGGNFGVATRMKFRLHELGGVYGGMLVLAATPQVLESFVAEAAAAPEELSAVVNVWRAPPVPFVPKEHHGKPVIMAMVCYAGPAAEGEKAVDRFRAIAPPLADMARPVPYPGLFAPGNPSVHPLTITRNLFLDRIDLATAETILAHTAASDATVAGVQLRVLGGAMARVPSDATAFPHRQAAILANLNVIYADPAEADRHTAWIEGFRTDIADVRQSDTGGYANFSMDLRPEQVRRALYPGATGDRLARIKAVYDPANVFHHNHNIAPATG